jgi:hypothetical protein
MLADSPIRWCCLPHKVEGSSLCSPSVLEDATCLDVAVNSWHVALGHRSHDFIIVSINSILSQLWELLVHI